MWISLMILLAYALQLPFLMLQKTDPQRSSLSGGIVQTAETLSIPVLWQVRGSIVIVSWTVQCFSDVFSYENKISVDADLIGETFVLTRCNSFFMMEKWTLRDFRWPLPGSFYILLRSLQQDPDFLVQVCSAISLCSSQSWLWGQRGEAISNPLMRTFRLVLPS